MLILILIDAQHSQKAVFSFEKGSNCQNHSLGSLHPVKKSPINKISDPLPPTHAHTHLTALWKTLKGGFGLNEEILCFEMKFL